MFRGWFIGNFEPSVLKTPTFEVGLLEHKGGEYWAPHVHKIGTEINLLISGRMLANGKEVTPGTIFVIEPGEPCLPVFLEDCKLLVIKLPSVPGDKYPVEDLQC